MQNSEKKEENSQEVIIDEKMIDNFIDEVLKLEQEHLYDKKHGMIEKIVGFIKARVR